MATTNSEFTDDFIKEQIEFFKKFEQEKNSPKQPSKQPDSTVDDDYLLALKLMQEDVDYQTEAERKARTLAEDEALAKLLSEQEISPKSPKLTSPPTSPPPKPTLPKPTPVLSDEEFAAQLSAMENQINTSPKPTPPVSTVLSDEEYAAQLAASENQMHASTYADAQIAKLLQEKQELEEKLRQAESMPKETIIDISSMEYPNTWEPQNSPFQSFDVIKGSQEWINIETHFNSTLKSIPILRIERVQNRSLWAWFYLKKKELEAKNSSSKGANEKYAFHGSRNNAYETILKEGFDHRVANMTGALGAGIYFAHQSATSSGYVGATGTVRKMLYCRVLAGDIGQGKSGLRRPPEKTAAFGFAKSSLLFDSVGNEGGVYVVFDNHQCYPEYVIHY